MEVGRILELRALTGYSAYQLHIKAKREGIFMHSSTIRDMIKKSGLSRGNKIEGKKLILIGELHGTKEIPEIISEFFSKFAIGKDFNLCLEIPSIEQANLNKFLLSKGLSQLDIYILEIIVFGILICIIFLVFKQKKREI